MLQMTEKYQELLQIQAYLQQKDSLNQTICLAYLCRPRRDFGKAPLRAENSSAMPAAGALPPSLSGGGSFRREYGKT
ncbi:MAG: hypothetical protein KBT08_10020, partial [Bacteroidales bacterium]|nr:hypothetical protein [Candidatus Cryptobacteroides onthequi]